MKKSVYSLILTDEVIDRLDRAAYARGVSRSALADEILAGYLSYTTPEMRMQQVLEAACRLLDQGEGMQLITPPSSGGMVLRSAIRYKYNPTVRYSVELFRAAEGPAGRLRAVLRTRSEVLLQDAARFFALWDGLERRLLGRSRSEIEPGRYTRLFVPEGEGWTSESLGQSIADYLLLFDGALRLYFDRLDSPQEAAAEVGRQYAAYLKSGKPTL